MKEKVCIQIKTTSLYLLLTAVYSFVEFFLCLLKNVELVKVIIIMLLRHFVKVLIFGKCFHVSYFVLLVTLMIEGMRKSTCCFISEGSDERKNKKSRGFVAVYSLCCLIPLIPLQIETWIKASFGFLFSSFCADCKLHKKLHSELGDAIRSYYDSKFLDVSVYFPLGMKHTEINLAIKCNCM